MNEKKRCAWVPLVDKLYVRYHDEEWGVPVHDDRTMFEFLVLESAQAGLSWRTVLHKRENYRRAFAEFDAKKVAKFTEVDVKQMLGDSGLIRNHAKIVAAISNARVFLDVASEYGSFCDYLWKFVGKPIDAKRKKILDIPPVTELAQMIAKDLKKRGFKFFGPTVCYAHLQATGLVNDHTTDCFRYKQVKRL
jgi:DNA-3-methyladenine glycosylase I